MGKAIPAPPAYLSEDGQRAWRDRWRYHNPDGVYRSTVGMPYADAEGNLQYACVGCWWCEGPHTDAHAEIEARMRAGIIPNSAALALFIAVMAVAAFLAAAFALDVLGIWDYPIQGERCPIVDQYGAVEDCG